LEIFHREWHYHALPSEPRKYSFEQRARRFRPSPVATTAEPDELRLGTEQMQRRVVPLAWELARNHHADHIGAPVTIIHAVLNPSPGHPARQILWIAGRHRVQSELLLRDQIGR